MLGKTKGMLTKEKALDLAYDYYNMLEVIKDDAKTLMEDLKEHTINSKEKKEVAKRLTKEINKIAKEVNAEPKKEEPKAEPIQLNLDKENETKVEEEETGQLRLSF